VLWVSQHRCDIMNQEEWHIWCKDVSDKLGNLEKTLQAYHKLQKRMLLIMITGFTGSLGYGILL